MSNVVRTARASSLRLADGLAVFWVALWFVIGAWVAYSIWELSAIGDTMAESGRALATAADALRRIGQLPLIGDHVQNLAEEVQATAADIVVRGEQTRLDLRRMSVLLGLAVVLLPVAPVLAGYLPSRLQRRREVRALRKALRQQGRGRTLDLYLARRAVAIVPFDRLPASGTDPWTEADGDGVRWLADAELDRLGLPTSTAAGPRCGR
jgi:hypothetical protein